MQTASLAAIDARLGHDKTFAALLAALGDVPETAVGEYTGNGGTKQDIALTFIPSSVEVYCQTTGGVSCVGIASASVNGYSWKLKAGTQTFAAQCILFTAGAKKFSIGTDADLNANASVYSYVAYGQ